MSNALTRHVGLNAGSWVLETLVKHYFEHLFKDKNAGTAETTTIGTSGELRRDELLYDEAFHIVKSFLDVSTHHTVEELQQFSNVRTPSPPWIHVMRVLVPMTSCDEAATCLIEALGGEEKTIQVVGGTKWWQVRGVKGVDAQWIIARKHYQQETKRRKQQEKAERARKETTENVEEEAAYSPEMDELRCILYFHGGGYYFGSVDQERYFIQRFARKSGCRLLAINYRLAPQYPFPCAIQDALAAYLYLIRPPPHALHTPVNPAHIVVSGDSAGGGLTFALLQVLRDANLPLPSGGVLISPWCDMTHSFPSIHINTDTDVIPEYGLAVYKPSTLWPPPSEDLTDKVQATLRSRIKQLAHQYSERGGKTPAENEPVKSPNSWKHKFSLGHRGRSVPKDRGRSRSPDAHSLADDALTGDVRAAAVSRSRCRTGQVDAAKVVDVGGAVAVPTADQTKDQTISMVTEDGERLEVHDQVQLYMPNNLMAHPLVSPALSYLGGLPPLLVIVSDTEVLRDEIIYSAHKAAHPERYPVKPEARHLYPKLEGIEERYGPTKVHLQVYDQTAHVLPVLFSFCTPAKFCFRAMAAFNKYVMRTLPALTPTASGVAEASPSTRQFNRRSLSLSLTRKISLSRNAQRRSTYSFRPSTSTSPRVTQPDESNDHDSQGSTRSSTSVQLDSMTSAQTERLRYAGNPIVYQEGSSSSPFTDNMIRERVSIRGEIRALEPESDLTACTMPPERIGVVGELAIRRYLEGRGKWDERFARTTKHIRKRRARNLNIAKKETVRNVEQLQMHFFQNADGEHSTSVTSGGSLGVREGLRQSAASWAWAWALDGAEHPPPSSIVARRDTEEARRLSRIADQPASALDQRMSGNNLWSFLINKLSLEKAEARVDQGVEHVGAGADIAAGTAQPTSPAARFGSYKPYWKRSKSRPNEATEPQRAKIRRFVSLSATASKHNAAKSCVESADTDAEFGLLVRMRSN